MTAHIHADAIAQYAEDSKLTSRSWELWVAWSHTRGWHKLYGHPAWSEQMLYRHNPDTATDRTAERVGMHIEKKIDELFSAVKLAIAEGRL
jgi:hypothetical protein